MGRHRVIYDGECALCRRTVQWLQRLDWLGRLDCVPAQAAARTISGHGTIPESWLQAVHCMAANGAMYRGARALRFVGLRLPLLCLPSLLLFLPGVLRLAERAYQWVARRRHRWNRCPNDNCFPHSG